MMRRLFAAICAMLVISGCIRNDIPYPVVIPHILSMDVVGAKSVTINQEKRTVDIVLQEEVDLRKVRILECKVDEADAKSSVELKGVLDLTEPLKVVLTTYQDYEWTVRAVRPVEKYFTVDGQVGSSVIDESNHRAVAYVNKNVQLSNVNVTSLKLGPSNVSTYSVQMEKLKNFSEPVELEVKYFDVMDYWTLYVEHSDQTVSIKSVNPWTREVYLTADGVAGQSNGFKYRKVGESGWIDVSGSAVEMQGGRFTAHITGLEASTEYEFYAFSGSDMTEVRKFRTADARQFPNNSFEHFSIVTGKTYYKWYDPACSDPESQNIWWACGNGEGPDGVNGTGSLGIVLTFPDADEKVDGDYSVRCESKNFAGLLACGNLFTGRFASLEGTTGGSVNYGRPWNTRPHAMKIWIKYESGPIDLIKDLPVGDVVNIGDNDRCEIAVSVGNWDYRKMGGVPESPVYVNTSKGIYYTSESPGVIGFGHLVLGESTDGWQQFEIPLEYKTLTEIPTHIIVTCAASYRGDYLTGSSKTKLWVDKAELVY